MGSSAPAFAFSVFTLSEGEPTAPESVFHEDLPTWIGLPRPRL